MRNKEGWFWYLADIGLCLVMGLLGMFWGFWQGYDAGWDRAWKDRTEHYKTYYIPKTQSTMPWAED